MAYQGQMKLSRDLDFPSVVFAHLMRVSDASIKMYDPKNQTNITGVNNYRYGVEFLENLAYPFFDEEYKDDVEPLSRLEGDFNPNDPETIVELNIKVRKLMWLLWKRGVIQQEYKRYDQYADESDDDKD